jgi:hypothetical protein
MSVTSVPEKVKIRLWGKAAGRCQYEGCNKPLWLDPITQTEFNNAYIAHIIADQKDGPRGDRILSPRLRADITNLMLLCDPHHRLIDKEDEAGHSVERLTRMKESHERRIEMLTSIGFERQSHVLLYGANIGQHAAAISFEKAKAAMVPDRYPAEARPIEISLINSSLVDRDPLYWQVEASQLESKMHSHLSPRLRDRSISHLSVFALAPQPLLMLLGHLLSDIPAAEVYQLHREPPDWRWQDGSPPNEFLVEEPKIINGPPAFVFALSATITDDRITAVIPTANIWRVTVPCPHNDFLRSRDQATRFRMTVRGVLDRIKARHGNTPIHVFPAVPVALAVDFGRVVMPKADPVLCIYDHNNTCGGFVHALDLPFGSAYDPPIGTPTSARSAVTSSSACHPSA